MIKAVKHASCPARLTRHLSVGLCKGMKVNPRTEEFKITAQVTPLSDESTAQEKEGLRSNGNVLIITIYEILTSDSNLCGLPDVVEYEGISYTIVRARDWSAIGGFYECIGQRIKR